MKYILVVTGLLIEGSEHYYMGGGMWSSEVADAKRFDSKDEAATTADESSYAAQCTIRSAPDAQEE